MIGFRKSKAKPITIRAVLKILLWFLPVLLFFILLPIIQKDFTRPEGTTFGFTFSTTYSEELNLDWQEVYVAMLDDLHVRNIRLPVYWNRVEARPDVFDWTEIDWQLEEASKRDANVVLAVGRRLPRWPECHDPVWLSGMSTAELEQELLSYVETTVLRYKDNTTITMWQVENEPFLSVFGECPPLDVSLLEKEIALVQKLDDHSRPIMVTESGELSTWIEGAKRADVVGTSMYKITWNNFWGFFYYPIPPAYYYYKAKWIGNTYDAAVIVSELQVEPWTSQPIAFEPLPEQFRSMDLDQVKDNIAFSSQTGFDTVYLWGVEWWYWLKEVRGIPEFWQYGKSLF